MSNEQQPDDDNNLNRDTNSVDNTQPDPITETVTTISEDIDNTPVKQIVESAKDLPMLLSPEIRRQSSKRGNVRNEKSVVQSVTRIELFDD